MQRRHFTFALRPRLFAPSRTGFAGNTPCPGVTFCGPNARAEANGTREQDDADERRADALRPKVELEDVTFVPATPENDATGLGRLIAANDGAGTFEHLRDDQRPLAQALSTRPDRSFLKSSYDIVGQPTAGVAATLDCGEEPAREQRIASMESVSRTRLTTNLPDTIVAAVRGNACVALEAALAPRDERGGKGDGRVTHFDDAAVRQAVLGALEDLTRSADTDVRRDATKFRDSLLSGAHRRGRVGR